MNIKQFWESRTYNQKGGLLSAALLAFLVITYYYSLYADIKNFVMTDSECGIIAGKSFLVSTEVIKAQYVKDLEDQGVFDELGIVEKAVRVQGLKAGIEACSLR